MNVESSTYICKACLYAYIHIHFTDPIPALRLFNMKQAMTTQQTMNIDKLKPYDRIPNNSVNTIWNKSKAILTTLQPYHHI